MHGDNLPFDILAHMPIHKGPRPKIEEIQYEQTEMLNEEEVGSRILIVDDEPYNIDGVRMLLQVLTQQYHPNFNFDHKVDTAGNG